MIDYIKESTFYYYRLYSTGIITILIWGLLSWDHFHGGVQRHHLLHRKELPAISNWWSGLLLPLFAWLLLWRIQKRIVVPKKSFKLPRTILFAFIAALCYGALISLCFTFNVAAVPGYLVIGLLLIAFFYPIYRSEYMLGFVLGMTFTFGAFIPIVVACIICLLAVLIYRFLRPAIVFLFQKSLNAAD